MSSEVYGQCPKCKGALTSDHVCGGEAPNLVEVTIRDRGHDLINHLKNWKHSHPDAYIMEQFIVAAIAKEQEITSLEQEITSLRAQVEALSQYPEEAVRAVVIYASDIRNLWSGNDFGDDRIYRRHKDKLAAIFKEKRGVGK